VSLSVELGLVLALANAFAGVIGFLFKYRGAQAAPAVDWRQPVRSSLRLFTSGWYSIGILVALGAWFFHVGALSLAPISLAQSVIAGGLVFLTIAADRIFGYTVTRREWIGVGLTALGLAFLAATLQGDADNRHADYAPGKLAVYLGAILVVGCGAAMIAGLTNKRSRNRLQDRKAAVLGVSAGLLWGASDVSIKALSGKLDDSLFAAIFHPLSLVVLFASLVGLLISAQSLQLGDAVPTIAVTNAAANVVTIAAGPLVFGEPFPHDGVGVALRLLAFALVIFAAALTPPPSAPISDQTAEPSLQS